MIITREKLIAELAQAERQVDLLNNQYHCALGVASAFRALLGALDQPESETAEAAPDATHAP